MELLHYPFQSCFLSLQLCPPCCPSQSVGRAALPSLHCSSWTCHPPAMPAEPRAVPPTLWGLGMSPETQSSPQTAQENPTFSSSQGACPARINHYPKCNNSMKPWMAAVPREGCAALFVSCPFCALNAQGQHWGCAGSAPCHPLLLCWCWGRLCSAGTAPGLFGARVWSRGPFLTPPPFPLLRGAGPFQLTAGLSCQAC